MVVHRHDSSMMCSAERTLALVPGCKGPRSLSRCHFHFDLVVQTGAWTLGLFGVLLEAIVVWGLVDGIRL